ncbi:MAG: hypothetical protein AB7S48_07885 [Bacteroidales bacterium]
MEKPILHIGYPKTATTWFQKVFYFSLKDVFYVMRDFISDQLIFPDVFSYNSAETSKLLNNRSDNKRLVICEELLLGGLDIGYGSGEFISQMANRLKNTFHDAEIVIFIRNQHTILESAYSHYIKSGGTYSVKKYLGLDDRLKLKFQNHHLFNPALFNYIDVINLYSDLFGRNSVHVFLYEDFKSFPELFMSNYCSELSLKIPETVDFKIKENVCLTNTSINMLRFLNHFTQRNTPFKNYIIKCSFLYPYLISFSNRLDRLKIVQKKPFRFSDDIHAWIEDYYRDKNRMLREYVDERNLKEYNYPI